jgi:hypothetical protein
MSFGIPRSPDFVFEMLEVAVALGAEDALAVTTEHDRLFPHCLDPRSEHRP